MLKEEKNIIVKRNEIWIITLVWSTGLYRHSFIHFMYHDYINWTKGIVVNIVNWFSTGGDPYEITGMWNIHIIIYNSNKLTIMKEQGIPWQNQPNLNGVILAHNQNVSSWQQDFRSCWHIMPIVWKHKILSNVLSRLFLLCFAQDPNQWNGAAHIQG